MVVSVAGNSWKRTCDARLNCSENQSKQDKTKVITLAQVGWQQIHF